MQHIKMPKVTSRGGKGAEGGAAAPYTLKRRASDRIKDVEKRESGRVREAEKRAAQEPKTFPFPGQVLLAHKYEETVDPTGWQMSEKLDGIRGYWSGKKLYTRNGNVLQPPDWFITEFPTDMSLDGELFGGRGMFQTTISIVKTANDPRWKNVVYKVFDIPSMGNLSFEKRLKRMNELGEEKLANIAIVAHCKCKGRKHIEEEMEKVLANGGEGLMIREPGSKYEHCRSRTLLKVKKFWDAEAVVIGYEKSKTSGGLGSLRCRMECGMEFTVGSGMTNKDKRNPPKIGTIITYKFQELSDSGKPRFPTYRGVRIDMDGPKDALVPAKIKQGIDES